MPVLARLFATLATLLSAPAAAQISTVTMDERLVADRGPASAARFVSPQHAQAERNAIAAFGPFRVVDERNAALVDITDAASPRAFKSMLAAYPQIGTLHFVEAPGTDDDRANLALGRLIRARGMATVAGAGGSVRSGAVELFIAGARRAIAPGAEFAVHGWLDDSGRGPEAYPAHAPEHRRYLDYYCEMGMGDRQAAAFYAMTNSVPFESARWLTGEQMRRWLAEAEPAAHSRLAFLDSKASLQ